MTNKVLSIIVAMLFFAVVVISVFGSTWSTVAELPENAADQSNIEAIGVLLFTDFVVPFEVLSIVLLATLIGATFMAKSEVKE